MSLEKVTVDLERSLLDVYPEAEDFLKVVRESGKLNLVHIYDNGSSLCDSYRFVYGKKVWAVRELEPYSEGGDWKEIGIALDRKDPAIYFDMRTFQQRISMVLALEHGFQNGKEKEYFDRLTTIFRKVFVEDQDVYYFIYDEEGKKIGLKELVR